MQRYQEKRNNHRMIAKAIVAAQAASDAGKGKQDAFAKREDLYMGYRLKVTHILRAIKLIDGKQSHFKYYVEKRRDQNGYPSVITYFSFNTKHGVKQVSFHTPMNLAKELKPYIGKGTIMRWNGVIGGSLEACELLSKIYQL